MTAPGEVDDPRIQIPVKTARNEPKMDASVPVPSDPQVGDTVALVPIARALSSPVNFGVACGLAAAAMRVPEIGEAVVLQPIRNIFGGVKYLGIPVTALPPAPPSVIGTFGDRVVGILAWTDDRDHVVIVVRNASSGICRYISTTDGGGTWTDSIYQTAASYNPWGSGSAPGELPGLSLYYAINDLADDLIFWDPNDSYPANGYLRNVDGATMTYDDAGSVPSYPGNTVARWNQCIVSWGGYRVKIYRDTNEFALRLIMYDAAGVAHAPPNWSKLVLGAPRGMDPMMSLNLLTATVRQDHLIINWQKSVTVLENDFAGIFNAPGSSGILYINPSTNPQWYVGWHDLRDYLDQPPHHAGSFYGGLIHLKDDGAGTLIGTGAHDAVFRSTDNLETFSVVRVPGAELNEIAAYRGDIWILDRYAAKVYRSRDRGLTWTPRDLPTGNGNYTRIEHCKGYLLFGTDTGTILKYPI